MRRLLKPDLTRPPDFYAFWDKTLAELNRVKPETRRDHHPEWEEPHRTLDLVSFRSFGGVWVDAYLVQWRGDERRPLVVHSHGYASQCAVRWDWSEAGFNVLGVDIRGFGRSFESHPLLSKWGWILTGHETPEGSILRGGICDYIRAVQVARELLGDVTSRLLLHGVSFAGGLALMAEAILQAADILAVGVPTFGWAEGRSFFVKSGSGAEIKRYLDERPEAAEDLMLVLRYFDPMNFAGMVNCPALVGVGQNDDIVPANTVYAIINHLAGAKEVMEFPYSHSDRPEEALWKNFERRWMELGLGGDLKPET